MSRTTLTRELDVVLGAIWEEAEAHPNTHEPREGWNVGSQTASGHYVTSGDGWVAFEVSVWPDDGDVAGRVRVIHEPGNGDTLTVVGFTRNYVEERRAVLTGVSPELAALVVLGFARDVWDAT